MSGTEIQHYSAEAYDIRPARNREETQKIWYPFMLEFGWDRGPADLATYLDHSKSRKMILAFPRDSAKPVGQVAAVISDNSTGWVGLFIVDKRHQGLGLGAALWNDMMTDLCATEYVGLDAVPEQKSTYERRDFVVSELGQIQLMSRPFPDTHKAVQSSVLDMSKVSAESLAQYELGYTGFYRPKLWENLLIRADVRGFVLTGASLDDIVACALIRRCPTGARLGPVYADTVEAAESVVSKAIDACSPEYVLSNPLDKVEMDTRDDVLAKAQIVVEVWSGNPEAVKLFERLGWSATGHYHRMWLNDKPTPAQDQGGAASTGLFASFDAAVG